MEALRDVIDKAKNVKPMAVTNGVPVVTFEEQRDMAQAEILEGASPMGLQINPDGSVARTPISSVAVNPLNYYANRSRKIKNELFVVVDYQSIQEQASGKIHVAQVPAYVVVRDSEGNLKIDRMVTVKDTEFVAEYTDILSPEAMALIKPLITAGVGITMKPLPI